MGWSERNCMWWQCKVTGGRLCRVVCAGDGAAGDGAAAAGGVAIRGGHGAGVGALAPARSPLRLLAAAQQQPHRS